MPDAPMSLRGYATRRGVSAEAVSKAIASGRLSESVTRIGGVPKIGDPDLADREWEANTQPRPDGGAADLPVLGVPNFNHSRAIREAHAARREAALADMAELDVGERRGELIAVEEARADVIDKFAIVRTRVLGVSSGVAQRLPTLAAVVVPVLDELLREALEELADGGGGL